MNNKNLIKGLEVRNNEIIFSLSFKEKDYTAKFIKDNKENSYCGYNIQSDIFLNKEFKIERRKLINDLYFHFIENEKSSEFINGLHIKIDMPKLLKANNNNDYLFKSFLTNFKDKSKKVNDNKLTFVKREDAKENENDILLIDIYNWEMLFNPLMNSFGINNPRNTGYKAAEVGKEWIIKEDKKIDYLKYKNFINTGNKDWKKTTELCIELYQKIEHGIKNGYLEFRNREDKIINFENKESSSLFLRKINSYIDKVFVVDTFSGAQKELEILSFLIENGIEANTLSGADDMKMAVDILIKDKSLKNIGIQIKPKSILFGYKSGNTYSKEAVLENIKKHTENCDFPVYFLFYDKKEPILDYMVLNKEEVLNNGYGISLENFIKRIKGGN